MVSLKPPRGTENGSYSPRQTTDFGRLAALGVLSLALLLRLWGIGWALPNATRYFSYHPDESVVTMASLSVNPVLLKLDPHFYSYGTLSLFLNSLAIQAAHALGLAANGPVAGVPGAGELLAARMVTALLGAATCGFIYGTGRVLRGRVCGLVAAALYAVAPLAVQHGHWATVDVPATFWIAGALYFAVRVASNESRAADFVWCGVFAGLAAATKYNGGLVLLAGLAALVVRRENRRPANVLKLCGAAAVAFVVGCPTILLNPYDLVTKGILFEGTHVARGGDLAFAGTASGFWFHVAVNLAWGLGPPLTGIALVAFAAALRRRASGDLVLLAFAIPYYVLIGMAQIKFARYTLPLFPPMLLFVGALTAEIRAYAARSRAPSVRVATLAGGAALAAAATYALGFAAALDQTMTLPDTRDRAAAYLRAQGILTVGVPTGPWFYSPTLEPFLDSPFPPVPRTALGSSTGAALLPTVRNDDWDSALLAATAPDAVAISEYEYADAQRLRLTDARAYLSAVSRAYPHRIVFSQPMQVFGLSFTGMDESGGLPVQHLPHDMLYANPAVVVYTK